MKIHLLPVQILMCSVSWEIFYSFFVCFWLCNQFKRKNINIWYEMGDNFDFFSWSPYLKNFFIQKVKAHVPFSSHHINLIDGKQGFFERKRKYKEIVSTILPNLSPMLLTSFKMNFISIPSLLCHLQEVLMSNELVLMVKAKGKKILNNPPSVLFYIQYSRVLRVALVP